MNKGSNVMKEMWERDQRLLEAIKSNLPQLESWLQEIQYDYEDGIYRFYHQSFKVYWLQNQTLRAVALIRKIADLTDRKISEWFETIIAQGTGAKFKKEHNEKWLVYTRPIVEAFLHARYFIEMMTKYGRDIETAPTVLPSGWAAILCLYTQR